MLRVIFNFAMGLAALPLLEPPAASAFLAGSTIPRTPTLLSHGRVSNIQVGASTYTADTVQAAWDNHLAAFGAQDVEKILLDYKEDSLLTTYNLSTDEKNVYKGVEDMRSFFTSLFASMHDISDLGLPFSDVSEEDKMVFIIWRCVASGYVDCTDTFTFDADNKIQRQNVVFKKE